MTIGEINGVSPGAMYPDRKTLAAAGVHRATQAGITGRAEEGAESIVLSGGYVDDVDGGSEIIYTGHGGRDPNTGRQIADQTFTRQNQALVTSCLDGLPVRVIRGGRHVKSLLGQDGRWWKYMPMKAFPAAKAGKGVQPSIVCAAMQ